MIQAHYNTEDNTFTLRISSEHHTLLIKLPPTEFKDLTEHVQFVWKCHQYSSNSRKLTKDVSR